MAVSSIKEKLNSPTLTVGEKGSRTATRSFDVVVSSVLDGPYTIYGAVDPNTNLALPMYGHFYRFGNSEQDLQSVVKTITIQRQSDENFKYWSYVVQYSTERDSSGGSQAEDPLLRPPLITYDFRTVRVSSNDAIRSEGTSSATYADMKNSAQQLFSPAPQFDKSELIIRVTRYFASFSIGTAQQLFNTINSATFLGAPRGCLRLTGLSSQSVFENGSLYDQVSAEFTYKEQQKFTGAIQNGLTGGNATYPAEGWQLLLLDRGFQDINGRKFRDKEDATPVKEPVFLNGKGFELRNANAPFLTPLYLSFQIYRHGNFDLLGLGV